MASSMRGLLLQKRLFDGSAVFVENLDLFGTIEGTSGPYDASTTLIVDGWTGSGSWQRRQRHHLDDSGNTV